MQIIFYLLLSFCFAAESVVLTIDKEVFSLQDFYSFYPKNQWIKSDSLKKIKTFGNQSNKTETNDENIVDLEKDPKTNEYKPKE